MNFLGCTQSVYSIMRFFLRIVLCKVVGFQLGKTRKIIRYRSLKMIKRFIGISLIIVFILIGISASIRNKLAVQNDSNQNNDLESLKKDVPMPKDNDPGLTAPVPVCNPQKVHRENFEKIKKGMAEIEIDNIFDGSGEPITTVEDYEQGNEIYRLEASDGKGKILITFQNEKVSEKKAVDLK